MKKLVVSLIIACMVPAIAFADRDHHSRDRHERRGGGVNPWPFIAGAVIGGIIVHEAGRDDDRYVERNPPRQRRVQLCQDFVDYDAYNRMVIRRECRYEWVNVD